MPLALLKTNKVLDRTVIKLYGFAKDVTEENIVAALMKRYQKLTGPQNVKSKTLEQAPGYV